MDYTKIFFFAGRCAYSDVPDFRVFKSLIETTKIGSVDMMIIGSSHAIKTDFGFCEIFSCEGFNAAGEVKSFDICKDSILHTHASSGDGWRADVNFSRIESMQEDGECSICHVFPNGGATYINILENNNEIFKYSTIHTYPEFDCSISTETSIAFLESMSKEGADYTIN